MDGVTPLDRTVVLAFDDHKPTLRTDTLLLGGVAAMVGGTYAILVGADAAGSATLRWAAVGWCFAVLWAMRWVSGSPRFTKLVHFRLTLRDGELDLDRTSPDVLAGTTRLPSGTVRVRRVYSNEGGAVRYCELVLPGGRRVLRAHDRPVADELTGERRALGDWLEAWAAGGDSNAAHSIP